MKKRFMQATTLLMAGAMFLGGCGASSDETGKTKAAEEKGQIELTFSHWGGDDTYSGVYKERIEAFEDKNPDIKINVLTVADDYETKLQTMIAGNKAPDVMQVAENGMGFASKGAFLDLTDKVAEAGIDTEALWGSVAEQYTYNDELFGLPDRGGCTILYYNKDMFDEAGLEYPSENWTMDDYYTALEKLTKDIDGDGVVDQWGATSTHYQAIWGYMLQGNGGSIIRDGKVTVNSPENLEALERYNEAYQNGWIVPYEELEKTSSGGDAYFLQGKLGMNLTGMWCIMSLAEDADFNFDISTVPMGNSAAGWPMGSALAISKTSSEEKQEAAWKFIQYMTSAEAQSMIGEGIADCPANLEVLNSDEFINQEINSRDLTLETIGTSMERVTIDGILTGPYYQEAIDECRNQIKEMLLGRLSTEECLEVLQKNLENVVSNYN